MINEINISTILSIIAFSLTIITTFFIVNKCHITQNINGIYLEVIYLSLLIAIIWTIYGYLEKKQYILIGNLIIILLLLYLLYLYYKLV
jgi:hypothetical protein